MQRGQPATYPRCINGTAIPIGSDCLKEQFTEELPGGATYSVLNTGNQRLDNTGIFTIPEGQYFFMGDNRDNSADSRLAQVVGGVGYVPYENLIGRADRIMFSSAGRSMLFFWTWRGDRFFEKLE